jgi:dihydromethanopterin reductase (acceptor)
LDLTSFISIHRDNLIVWCLTGGGDLFEENFKVFSNLYLEGHPILAIFSSAGAVVQNRYGFFWRLTKLKSRNENVIFLFESKISLQNNVQYLLEKANITYQVFPQDQAFSLGIWLANQKVKCIIASPLTANSVAKLTHGVADTLIGNILSAGKKANQLVGIFPTDRSSDSIMTRLPVRQKKPLPKENISIDDCIFDALEISSTTHLKFSSEKCVGCQHCVQKYPEYFSVNEELEVQIRKVDQVNSQKLESEFHLFRTPDDITSFVSMLDIRIS